MDYSTVTAVCTAKLAKENAQKIAEVANTMVAQADVDALRKAAFESYTQLSRRIDEGGGGGGTVNAYTKTESDNKFATKVALNSLQQAVQQTGTELGGQITDLTNAMATAQSAVNTRFDTLQQNLTTELDKLNTKNANQDNKITAIEAVIPSSATSTNQLADVESVKELVLAGAARGLSASAEGAGFESYAALAAGPWYNVGEQTEPTKNDYAVVKKDASHSNNDTRYNYDGAVWVFYQEFSGGGFTPTTQQQLAIDSGITQTKVASYDTLVNTVTQEITALKQKDVDIDSALGIETGKRESKDNELAASISSEQLARLNKDNELLGYIGAIADLDTEDKSSTVNAINSLTNTLCDLDTFVMKGRSTYSTASNVMMSSNKGDKKTYFDIGGGFDLSRIVADSNSASYITFDFPNGCFTYIQATADSNPLEVGIYLDSEAGTKLGTAWVNFTSATAVYPTNISYSVPKPKFPTIDAIYPVGSVYISMLTSFDPNTAWAGTTWTKIKTGLFLEASDTAGTEKSAGLPNITGYMENYDQTGRTALLTDWGINCVGVFNWTQGSYNVVSTPISQGSGTCKANQITFDASRSSSVYGASTTVQPNSMTVIMWQRTA